MAEHRTAVDVVNPQQALQLSKDTAALLILEYSLKNTRLLRRCRGLPELVQNRRASAKVPRAASLNRGFGHAVSSYELPSMVRTATWKPSSAVA